MMYSIMHRTQLSLEDWQHEALKARAEREGKSVSELVREILSAYLRPKGQRSARSLQSIEGVAEGPADLARAHDRYLGGE